MEVERARLTHILAQIKEEEGEVAEAANILQELQVETYGSMEKREKVGTLCFVQHLFYTTFLLLFIPGWTYTWTNEIVLS